MAIQDPIEHVIVLMLENASFDRMLGAMPGVDGVDPAHPQSNPDYPLALPPVVQAPTTERTMNQDPEHDLDDVLRQLNGPLQGFISDFAQQYPQSLEPERAEVMGYYTTATLTVLPALAAQFGVCDRWFSSLPGPTWPNRFFVHSGTSLGHVDMPEGVFQPGIHLYDQTTVYDLLSAAGKSWAIYYGDFPQSLVMTHQLGHLDHYHPMDKFFQDVAGAETAFPQYSFIEPSYFGKAQNDQHPPSDVLRGELLIAQVYNALRANESLWEKSLLVVLYDEHGGFYDHVYPPAAVPPDGNTKTFAFNLYGLRVPAVLISPWIDPGTIHDVFDHTSLLAYVTKKWDLDRFGHLSNRVDAASTFVEYLQKRPAFRPNVLPKIAEPAVLENDLSAPLNMNQKALIGFSRFLELKTADAAQAGGGNVSKVFQEIGERLVQSMQTVDGHGQAAVDRLDAFLEASRTQQAKA
jgi:phospholipase C